MRIIQCYWQRQALGLPTTYVSIADEIGVGWKCVKTWVNRIPELMTTGSLQHRPRSGRKKHIAFRTEQKTEESMDVCENLREGEHKKHAAQKLGCCEKTIYNNTKGKMKWRVAPYQEDRHTEDVDNLRMDWGFEVLTENGELKDKYANAAHIDHKRIHWFGQNRTHTMQARRIGSTKPLRPRKRAQHNPSVHMMGVAIDGKVTGYLHGHQEIRPLAGGYKTEDHKVNGDEYETALVDHVIPFLHDNDVDYVIADCVAVNHCQTVKDCWEDHNIQLHPTATAAIGGYPPYSHDCSILDGWLYGPFQEEISEYCATRTDITNRALRKTHLFDCALDFWESGVYDEMSTKAFHSYAGQMHKIILNQGKPTGK